MPTVVGIEATVITLATATPTTMTQDQKLWLPPETEQTYYNLAQHNQCPSP